MPTTILRIGRLCHAAGELKVGATYRVTASKLLEILNLWEGRGLWSLQILRVLSMTSITSNPTLIVAGRLRGPDGAWSLGEVWISGEKVVAVHHGNAPAAPDVPRLDVGDEYVLPGAVDAHVHSLSNPGEGLTASTASAAAGGVTTIVEMPFDAAGPINNRDRIRNKQDLTNDEAIVDVALLGTLAPDGGWREAPKLVDEGAVGFKVSLFLTDAYRFPRIDDLELQSVMAAVAEAGSTLCTHAENNEIIKGLLPGEAQSTDAQAHTRTRPPVAETLAVLTALESAAEHQVSLHVCHLSLPRSVTLVNWYAQQGVDVTLETCPHYLTFTSADLDEQWGHLKINPPLRTAEDRAGMWNLLESGAVDIISSDHAPWSLEVKDKRPILANASGAPGVQTLVPMTLGRALARSEEAFNVCVDALTISPARRYGLDTSKGSIAVGKDADLMTFAPDPDYSIQLQDMRSNAGWTPYEGMAPGGRVGTTISRGTIIYSASAGLTGQPGRGQVLHREA